MKINAISLCGALLLAGCGDVGDIPVAALTDAPATPGKEVPTVLVGIAVAQTVDLPYSGGGKIQFLDVQDSRCPSRVMCIWPGNGATSFKVSQPQCKDTVFVLNTHQGAREITLGSGIHIALVDLIPYPDVPDGIPKDLYFAKLGVDLAHSYGAPILAGQSRSNMSSPKAP